MGRRILVVGGGYAGVLFATRLARKTCGRDVSIALVERRPWFVERIRLHEDLAGARHVQRPIAAVLDGTGVSVIAGSVRALDLGSRRADVACDGGTRSESFDDLVLATGSRARAVPKHAFAFATEEDVRVLGERLDRVGPDGRVVVVGGGLTAVEVASELAERREQLRITLVTEGEVAPGSSPSARAHVRDHLGALGVTVVEHERVVAVDRDEIVLEHGSALASDVTLWAAGFEAAPLVRETGLLVDEVGRAFVDARLRALGHDFVHVIGDAAHVEMVRGDGTRAPLRMSCAAAMPMGAFAADDLARELQGAAPKPFTFGWFVQCLSLGRNNGLVQKLDADDRPTRVWVDGRLAAWLKERICRYTLTAIALEKRGLGYVWPGSRSLASARCHALLPEHGG